MQGSQSHCDPVTFNDEKLRSRADITVGTTTTTTHYTLHYTALYTVYWTYIQDSHWSSSYITALSLVESFIMLLAPTLLCHKEPARRIQSPLLGALERKIPLGGYFACSSLVLYGIRAPIIGPFRAWKPPILMS